MPKPVCSRSDLREPGSRRRVAAGVDKLGRACQGARGMALQPLRAPYFLTCWECERGSGDTGTRVLIPLRSEVALTSGLLLVVVACRARQLVGEGRYGFRINRRLVPLEKSGKVRLALLPPGATLPAVCVEEICRRSERVLRVVDQVAAIAVAVDVDRVFQIRRGQELRLADFTGPGAAHPRGRQIAALNYLQCIQQLRVKAFRPPAIVGQRGQRAEGRIITRAGAEPGLEAPDRDQHRPRDPVALFDPLKRARVPQQQSFAFLDPERGDVFPSEAFETLSECPLTAIVRDHVIVVGKARQRRFDDRTRNALLSRLLLERGEPAVEPVGVVSTLRGSYRRGAEYRCGRSCQRRGSQSRSGEMNENHGFDPWEYILS